MEKTEIKSEHNLKSNLERFNAEILASTQLQELLKAATNSESLINLVLELGQERGYLFTKEEVIAALAIETSLGQDYQEYGVSLKSGTVVAGCGCSGEDDDDNNSNDENSDSGPY